MHTDTVSIDQFVKSNQITMTSTRVDRNPSMPDSSNMDHWKCSIRRPGRTMTVYFSMGYGHNGATPSVADVLDCLASDSSSASDDFEEFCGNMGYDTDSRKAEKIYKTVQHQAARLSNFLDSTLYDQLLYGTERQ